ncbi:MAG: phage NrS-1 polymerase family protein [Ktedonobacterales bacterium]
MSAALLTFQALNHLNCIPAKVRAMSRWVVFHIEHTGEGETLKIPRDPKNGDPASSIDPETWSPFDVAVRALREGSYDALGFALGDGVAGVDLDHCRNSETGEIAAWARTTIDTFASYTEASVSGTGVHILIEGKMPNGQGRKHGNKEAYSDKRFFIVTGQHLDGTPVTAIEPRQGELDAFVRTHFPAQLSDDERAQQRPYVHVNLSDDELLAKACAAKNGTRFTALWNGDDSTYGNDMSRGDLACCLGLAFWTGRDAERMDRLFRQSSRYRDKWDQRRGAMTYGKRTIDLAIGLCSEVYTAQAGTDAGESAEGAEGGNACNDPEWDDDPAPLPDGMPSVARFDLALLPDALRPWIGDIAERMQVPIDYPAVAAMVARAALVGRQIAIYPKRRDDWLVVPNLWGAIVGPPAAMKTPSLEAALKPLNRLIAEAAQDYEQALAEYETTCQVYEAKKAAHAADLKRAAKCGDEVELAQLAANPPEKPAKPVAHRYSINDATVEKIGEILLNNPNGLLQFRDELVGFLRNLDRPGHEGDRAFFLESWNGTGGCEVDRIGRGSLHVSALCLSLLGGIQPGPLASYVCDANSDTAGNDGLLQRFQLLVWPDPSASWRNVDRWPDTAAKNTAYAIYRRLASLNVAALGTKAPEDDPVAIPALRFSSDAQDIFDTWRERLEHRLRSEGMSAPLEAHLAKYRSLMPSLALLFHLIDFDVRQHTEEVGVGVEAAVRAVTWCEYLESHARRLYAHAENPALERARALFDHIQAGEVRDGTPVRQIYRHQWSRLLTPDEVSDAIKLLEAFGWVRSDVRQETRRGRPSDVLRIHPALSKKQREPA